ncbi:MAG: hypothetical protein AB1716_15115 [Planctomycetota bacterium]
MGRPRLRRLVLVFFAFLDVLLLVRFAPDALRDLQQLRALDPPHAYLTLLIIGRALFFASLPLSAAGLLLAKRWGLILSYAQFPFRLLFVLLSFGFITIAARLLHAPELYEALVVTAMVLEVARLVCSIWIHRHLKAG